MENRKNALKAASKAISVVTKIGYTVMIVVMGLSAAMLIYMAVTGGEVAMFAIGGTNIIVYDQAAASPAQIAAICAVLLVMGGLFLAIFLLACRMFHEISVTGDPFAEGYGKTVRVIGILTAAAPIVAGIVESIVTVFSAVDIPEIFTDVPGIVVGGIIFCLSYIIDYGCGLEKKETV